MPRSNTQIVSDLVRRVKQLEKEKADLSDANTALAQHNAGSELAIAPDVRAEAETLLSGHATPPAPDASNKPGVTSPAPPPKK